jgi:catechol 2,3-dioxygenase-like lactoylglutathione lyase family enzyme
MKPRITIITLGAADLPRAIQFYRDGLGFPTDAKDDASIAFFMTRSVRLALYPRKALFRLTKAGASC